MAIRRVARRRAYEHPAEEWLLVLDGNPTLREPDGEHRLEPMDVAFFAAGPGGAHQVRNDSAETVRVLMWGENPYPATAIYPDSNNIRIWIRPGEGSKLYRLGTELDDYNGETGQSRGALWASAFPSIATIAMRDLRQRLRARNDDAVDVELASARR